jgi:HD domain
MSVLINQKTIRSTQLTEIRSIMMIKGGRRYPGEIVSQREHARQIAWLAYQSGADDDMVTAALLHDIGHLIGSTRSSPEEQRWDRHETAGAQFLENIFPPKVTDLIRFHHCLANENQFTIPQELRLAIEKLASFDQAANQLYTAVPAFDFFFNIAARAAIKEFA